MEYKRTDGGGGIFVEEYSDPLSGIIKNKSINPTTRVETITLNRYSGDGKSDTMTLVTDHSDSKGLSPIEVDLVSHLETQGSFLPRTDINTILRVGNLTFEGGYADGKLVTIDYSPRPPKEIRMLTADEYRERDATENMRELFSILEEKGISSVYPKEYSEDEIIEYVEDTLDSPEWATYAADLYTAAVPDYVAKNLPHEFHEEDTEFTRSQSDFLNLVRSMALLNIDFKFRQTNDQNQHIQFVEISVKKTVAVLLSTYAARLVDNGATMIRFEFPNEDRIEMVTRTIKGEEQQRVEVQDGEEKRHELSVVKITKGQADSIVLSIQHMLKREEHLEVTVPGKFDYQQVKDAMEGQKPEDWEKVLNSTRMAFIS